MTTPNRADILAQVSAGQITADQAAQLLTTPVAPRADLSSRWLHIRVTDLATGKNKVTLNLPLTWVEAGMKVGARSTDQVPDINWAEVVQAIESGATGTLVEVEDMEDGERVEITVR